MPKVKLTDRFVQAAAAKQQVDYFDTNIAGLCLRVSPAGRKSWSLTYTRPGTRKRSRTTLGVYPQTSLAQARVRAVKAKGKLEQGVDPNAAKIMDAAPQTLAALAEDYFARHVRKQLRSAHAVQRRMRKNIVAIIGNVRLADLHRRDVVRAVDKVLDRDAPTEAVRTFEDLRALIRWAVGRGVLDHNITDGMKPPAKLLTRERVLTPDEVRQLWEKLPEAKMSDGSAEIVRLCLITAQRVGEVAGMRRDELDLQKRLWSLPGARTKNGESRTVPLSENALTVISEALERAGESPFVFPGGNPNAPIAAHTIATAVRRSHERIGIPHWTAHDLRRTALTEMAALGIDPFTLGHVANHISTTKATVTTSVYSRCSWTRRKSGKRSMPGRRGSIPFSGRAPT